MLHILIVVVAVVMVGQGVVLAFVVWLLTRLRTVVACEELHLLAVDRKLNDVAPSPGSGILPQRRRAPE